MIELFNKDNSGEIRRWAITIDDDGLMIEFGLYGGATQTKYHAIPEGKGGRSISEQRMLEFASRVSKHRDQGYVNDLREAMEGQSTNILNLPKPMLARKHTDVSIPSRYYLQAKYDGNRCLITKQSGKVIAYTRNGKAIESIEHILAGARDIPEGTILDGELYCHGVPLQTLRSWIARKQASSNGLIYMCYDIISPEPYQERLERLNYLPLYNPISIAATRLIDRDLEPLAVSIKETLDNYRAKGYEGLIVRCPRTPYESGKRSAGLIKVKAWEDDEFRIIDVIPSADSWGRLVCVTRDGGVFNVSAPGTIPEKAEILDNKQNYIGCDVTIEFAYYTKSKLPFHPNAIAIRPKGI